ncbi:N-acetylmannosamine-6-phosphate 2-epimerase [Paenibacillus sp. P96]|uniref:Putative N-acetylmannosamine-6-phosphate 2-epimerase n=1 Tax=Paenibacillus zeirhizosphaerae TaxID=2987519 RepID=A0ABT9FXA4_9BACL|nr:N-acetylmannosamine-6-phosphate 2-epimerase [Paenibacillus sp. P96]MDP4099264.1 N-acetylmannosamine-6-phosphate 2-epimerase [Paenibacillus sp. P96]
MTPVIEKLQAGLIVSCQALPGEPLHGAEVMAKMALAAQEGGAVAIRANGAADVRAIKKAVALPVIGLVKRQYEDSEVYITPTLREMEELEEAGADMIAIDATHRPRPGGGSLEELICFAKSRSLLCMADISTLEEARYAASLGVHCISTTLSGYTSYSPAMEGPHLELIQEIVGHVKVPVIAEGRIQEPSQVEEAFRRGAYAVVVGSAITRPQLITQRFAEAARRAVISNHGHE